MAVIFGLSVFSFVSWLPPAGPAQAMVYFRGEELPPVALGIDAVIPLKDSGIRLEVKNRGIRVLENNCPRSVCLHAGWISNPGEIICCVPKRLIVEISGSGRFDAISR